MPSSWCAYARASICGYSRGSTPASTRGDSRWSCETGTPAIISPTRLRTASARSSVEPRRRKRRFSYRSRARRVRVIIPDSYAARAKNTPEEPAISVLSRSKNAAAWPSPFSPCIAMSAPSDPEDDRVALSPARADRRAAETAAAAPQLVHEAPEDARAARADRVTERNRSAVDIHALLVDPEHADRVECHRGERLVDLPQVDVAGLKPRLLERLLRRARGRCREVREVVR